MKRINYWSYPAVEVNQYGDIPFVTHKKLSDLMKRVCFKFNVTEEEIKGRSRIEEINEPRIIFCYLAHKLLNLTCIHVGSFLNRNHATILNACKRVEGFMKFDKEYRKMINELK